MAEPARDQLRPASARKVPPIAVVSAIVGLAPLAVLAGLVAWPDGPLAPADANRALVAYAAMLLVFSAGARFGLSIRTAGLARHALVVGAAPLLGLAATLMPARPALAMLAVAIAASGAFDVWSADRGTVPAWYGRVRIATSSVAIVLIVAAFLLVGDA